MKNKQDEYAMDGSFEIEGETIYYRITDDTKPIRMVRGVEKMGRYISFYKESGEHIGTTSIYDTYERMSNITHFDAAEWYKEYKKM